MAPTGSSSPNIAKCICLTLTFRAWFFASQTRTCTVCYFEITYQIYFSLTHSLCVSVSVSVCVCVCVCVTFLCLLYPSSLLLLLFPFLPSARTNPLTPCHPPFFFLCLLPFLVGFVNHRNIRLTPGSQVTVFPTEYGMIGSIHSPALRVDYIMTWLACLRARMCV